MGVLDGDKPTEEQKLSMKKEKVAQIEMLDAKDVIGVLAQESITCADIAFQNGSTDNFSSDSLGPLAAEIFKEYVLQFKAGDTSIIKMVYRTQRENNKKEDE
jgi:hypothetical protein